MRKARVLVVDDAMLIRRLVCDALASDTAIEVVGEAANGRIALQKIDQLAPDLVTLDIEMPEMDGLATLREIRKAHPRLPVIMFSALTERGAADTLEALQIGASDYVTKPVSSAGKGPAQQRIQADLVPKIRSLCRVGQSPSGPGQPAGGVGPPLVMPVMPPRRPEAASRANAPAPTGPAPRADIVAMGLSTGGPNALGEMLSALPADFQTPIVIVQHMPNMFTRLLAERLNGQTKLSVVEAADGQRVQAGTVYVAPGDFHLTVRWRNGQIVTALGQEAPEHSHRPAADVLFRSVAEVYGPRALALVLTGMGEDGLRGCEEIARVGGHVIVQDEASSVVWEMPGRVAAAGLAEAVLPLGALAGELMRRTARRSSES